MGIRLSVLWFLLDSSNLESGIEKNPTDSTDVCVYFLHADFTDNADEALCLSTRFSESTKLILSLLLKNMIEIKI
jgi:hypothetical protein